MKSNLKPLSAAIQESADKQFSAVGGTRASLFEVEIFGVPLMRVVIQVAGGVLMLYLLGDITKHLPPGLQLAGVIGLISAGLFLGYLVWDTLGAPLMDFLSKIFPFQFS